MGACDLDRVERVRGEKRGVLRAYSSKASPNRTRSSLPHHLTTNTKWGINSAVAIATIVDVSNRVQPAMAVTTLTYMGLRTRA